MPRFNSHRVAGALLSTMAITTATAGTAVLPAPALASQSHVITLYAPTDGTTCQQRIDAVTTQYAINPRYTYTSATCGFSAMLQKRTVDSLRVDPRVQSVTADGSFSGV